MSCAGFMPIIMGTRIVIIIMLFITKVGRLKCVTLAGKLPSVGSSLFLYYNENPTP
jgi:hypothetical protein